MKTQIPFKEFRQRCLTNSDTAPDTFIVKGQLYDWVGIGVVSRDESATEEDYEKYPEVVD